MNGIVGDGGQLFAGRRQAYARALTDDGETVGEGIYASNDLAVAMKYASRITVGTCDGPIGFKTALMCRAERPRAPVSRPDYCVCDKLHAYKMLIVNDVGETPSE